MGVSLPSPITRSKGDDLVPITEHNGVMLSRPQTFGPTVKSVRANQGVQNYPGSDFMLNLQRDPLLMDLEAELQSDHPVVRAKRAQLAENLLRSEGENWQRSVLFVRDIITVWNAEDLMIPDRLPATIGHPTTSLDPIANHEQTTWAHETVKAGAKFAEHSFSSAGVGHTQKHSSNRGFLNMPIKAPNSDVVIPPELLAQPEIRSLVQDVVAFETLLRNVLFWKEYPQLRAKIAITLYQAYGINLDECVAVLRDNNWILFDDYFSYLTVEQSVVQPGKAQRHIGFHVDGFQGKLYPDKIANDRSYLWTNRDATTFAGDAWSCPKDINGQPDYDVNWFEGPGSMTEALRRPRCSGLPTGQAGMLEAMSGLQIHEASKAPADTPVGSIRLWIRLEFSLKHFNRHGDTVNPRLGKFTEYTDRSIVSTVPNGGVHSTGGDFGMVVTPLTSTGTIFG